MNTLFSDYGKIVRNNVSNSHDNQFNLIVNYDQNRKIEGMFGIIIKGSLAGGWVGGGC